MSFSLNFGEILLFRKIVAYSALHILHQEPSRPVPVGYYFLFQNSFSAEDLVDTAGLISTYNPKHRREGQFVLEGYCGAVPHEGAVIRLRPYQ